MIEPEFASRSTYLSPKPTVFPVSTAVCLLSPTTLCFISTKLHVHSGTNHPFLAAVALFVQFFLHEQHMYTHLEANTNTLTHICTHFSLLTYLALALQDLVQAYGLSCQQTSTGSRFALSDGSGLELYFGTNHVIFHR